LRGRFGGPVHLNREEKLMALGTITKVDSYVMGNKRVKVVDVQLSTGANWTAAGESLTAALVGLRKITKADCDLAMNSTPLTFQVRYDYTNSKLIAFGQNAVPGAAVGQPVVTANTDLSGYTTRIRFEGW
jgi:hypothetical protein